MTAASISHFVRQGNYRNEDIPALTPCLGQLQKLEQRLQLSFAIVVGDQDSQDTRAKGFEDDNGEETTATTGSVCKTTLLNVLKIAPVNTLRRRRSESHYHLIGPEQWREETRVPKNVELLQCLAQSRLLLDTQLWSLMSFHLRRDMPRGPTLPAVCR